MTNKRGGISGKALDAGGLESGYRRCETEGRGCEMREPMEL